jgi:hypothetical protein
MTPILASAGGDVAAGGVLSVLILAAIIFSTLLYFVPTVIAFVKNKANKVAILVLNIFLGWSLIGWVVALVWAVSEEPKQVVLQQTFMQPMPHEGSSQSLDVPPRA